MSLETLILETPTTAAMPATAHTPATKQVRFVQSSPSHIARGPRSHVCDRPGWPLPPTAARIAGTNETDAAVIPSTPIAPNKDSSLIASMLVVEIARKPNVVVSPDSGIDSWEAFEAKATGSGATFTGAAPGSLAHVTSVALGAMFDTEIGYLPTSGGGEAVNEVMGGRADTTAWFSDYDVRFGLKALAIFAPERWW